MRTCIKKIYPSIKFVVKSAFIAIMGKFIIAFLIVISTLFSNINIDDLLTASSQIELNSLPFFLFVCFFTPLIETILFQLIPITLLQKYIANHKLIVSIDAILFASLHWYYSFAYAIILLPLASVLAWSFVLHSNDSIKKALWITAGIHAVYNFSTYLSMEFL